MSCLSLAGTSRQVAWLASSGGRHQDGAQLQPPSSRILRMERSLELSIPSMIPAPNTPTSSFAMLSPASSWIPTRSTMPFCSRTASGFMENPCGSRLLMRRLSPSGKSSSPRVPHLQRSRPFLPQMVFADSLSFDSSLIHPNSSSHIWTRAKFWYGTLGIPDIC